jgi:hypothetical protein
MGILFMSISDYYIDPKARKAHKIKRIREGKCLIKGFFALK